MDAEAFKILWVGTAAASGIAVVITLIAAPQDISSWSVGALVVLGVTFFSATVIGLGWAKQPFPITGDSVKSLIIFAVNVAGMVSLGWKVWPKPETKSSSEKLICQVMTVQFEPAFRFFQSPPVYFQRLDTMLRISLTNQTGKPLYIRGYSVAALRGVEWVQFKNADSAAFEPYAFGVMSPPSDKPFIRRFDLSANGFDYVMQHKALNPDESVELWMFFISGLTRENLPEISQFKFTFYDSAKEEFACT